MIIPLFKMERIASFRVDLELPEDQAVLSFAQGVQANAQPEHALVFGSKIFDLMMKAKELRDEYVPCSKRERVMCGNMGEFAGHKLFYPNMCRLGNDTSRCNFDYFDVAENEVALVEYEIRGSMDREVITLTDVLTGEALDIPTDLSLPELLRLGFRLTKAQGVARSMKVQNDEHNQPLVCYGCFASKPYDEQDPTTVFPGAPARENHPCNACSRNVNLSEEELALAKLDYYRATDMVGLDED